MALLLWDKVMTAEKHLKTGTRIGHLTVKYRYPKGNKYYYHCECDCGSVTNVESSRLEHQKQLSCLCRGQYLEVGKTYDRLTVRKRLKRGVYECDCACGKKGFITTTSDVLSGRVRGCGCTNEPYNRKIRKDNTTGIRGVTYNNKTGKYLAYIANDGKNKYLGSFSDPAEARIARETAENELRRMRETGC